MLRSVTNQRELVLRLILAELLARRGEGPLARPVVGARVRNQGPRGGQGAALPPESEGSASAEGRGSAPAGSEGSASAEGRGSAPAGSEGSASAEGQGSAPPERGSS